MQAYIDKYDFEHEVITGAVDEQANVTFSFWQDKVRAADRSDRLYARLYDRLHESIAMLRCWPFCDAGACAPQQHSSFSPSVFIQSPVLGRDIALNTAF